MVFSVTYPILRRMLGYIDDDQLYLKCHLMTLGVQMRLPWHEYVQQYYEVHTYVTQWSTS